MTMQRCRRGYRRRSHFLLPRVRRRRGLLFSSSQLLWCSLLCVAWIATTTTMTVTVHAVHREDASPYFLFIEPSVHQRADRPVNDALTEAVREAWQRAETGTSRYADPSDLHGAFTPGASASYRGMHFCEDGAASDTVDYRLPNGLITHSLCVHYVRWYRAALPETERTKLQALYEFMQETRQRQSDESQDETEL